MNTQAREKPLADQEPKPPFPKQHQQGPGIEAKLDPRPRYQAEAYKAAGKLEDRVALVTGGDSGIGRAVAVLFAREGADVMINYLPEEQVDAEETRDAVEAEGRRCLLMPGNLTDASFCKELVDRTVRELGKLDILVSNAAHQNRKDTLADLTDEEMAETFETNVYACIRLARASLEHMDRGGVILVTTSETGILGSEKLPDYSATKGALNAFVKALAMNVIDKGIRVNAVAPGPVWTPLNPSDAGMDPEKVSKFGTQSPMKRPAQPEELAPA
jgi:NAD(P)-dependent dehydrogenase (short-subunit alcohol dehydrogenase family)